MSVSSVEALNKCNSDLVVKVARAQPGLVEDAARRDLRIQLRWTAARKLANFTGLALGCIEAKFCK